MFFFNLSPLVGGTFYYTVFFCILLYTKYEQIPLLKKQLFCYENVYILWDSDMLISLYVLHHNIHTRKVILYQKLFILYTYTCVYVFIVYFFLNIAPLNVKYIVNSLMTREISNSMQKVLFRIKANLISNCPHKYSIEIVLN